MGSRMKFSDRKKVCMLYKGFLRPRKRTNNLKRRNFMLWRSLKALERGFMCFEKGLWPKRGLCLGKGKTWLKMDFIHLEGNFMHRNES